MKLKLPIFGTLFAIFTVSSIEREDFTNIIYNFASNLEL